MGMNLKAIEESLITKTSAICFAFLGVTLGAVAFMKYRNSDSGPATAEVKDTRDAATIDLEQRLAKASELMRNKLYREAEEMLLKLGKDAPKNARVYSSLAMAQKKTNQIEKSIVSLSRAVELEPGQWILHNNMGLLMLEAGRGSEAIKSFDRALDLSPGTLQILLSRAKALESMGRYDGAVQSYQKALEGGKLDGTMSVVIKERLKKLDVLAFIERGDR